MAGKPWYTNGIDEIQVNTLKGEIIPDGYYKGRRPRTARERATANQKLKQTLSNRTQSDIERTRNKRSQSLKATY